MITVIDENLSINLHQVTAVHLDYERTDEKWYSVIMVCWPENILVKESTALLLMEELKKLKNDDKN